jgi:hypothetical protein
MRNILLIAFTALFSCNNNQNQASVIDGKVPKETPEAKMDSLIHEYMKTHINDYASYQSVYFRNNKPDSTTIYDDPNYMKLNNDEIVMRSKYAAYDANTPSSQFGTYKYLYGKKAIADSVVRIAKKELETIQKFKSRPCGWGITHVFRRKNKNGGIVLDSIYFRFDSSYNLKEEEYYSLINKD